MSATLQGSMILFLRDISRVYTQSQSRIQRSIFVRPPIILKIPSNMFYRILRPHYGFSRSGIHWFNTYHRHHTKRLSMIETTHEHSLFYNKDFFDFRQLSSVSRGITCLQTEDTLNLGNKPFFEDEESCLRMFESRPSY